MEIQCKICKKDLETLFADLYDDRYGYPGRFSVLRCRHCGFGQLDPEPSGDVLRRIYTEYYPRKNISPEQVQSQAHYQGALGEKVKIFLQGNNNIAHRYIRPGSRVLDVGCGDGTSLLEIQKLGAEAYGTEYDENIRPVIEKLNLRVHLGDEQTMPWPDHYFDYITMSQLLEHTLDPIQFVRSVKRKLKPTGQIIMSFPNIDSFNRKRSGRKWVNWHVPYHVNFFSKESIQQLASECKMEVLTMKTTTPVLWMHIQFDMDSVATEEGSPSPAWTNTIPRTRKDILVRKFYLLALSPYLLFQNIFKKGDSWVVILQPKEGSNIA